MGGKIVKKEIWIYLLAFLSGVLFVNFFDGTMENSSYLLNRYTLMTLTFQEIVYEEYFIYILYLRLRSVIVLWALSKLLSEKLVKAGFAVGISILLGMVAAMSVLVNGIWGIWFFVVSFFPHIFFYGFAYRIWYSMTSSYKIEGERRRRRLLMLIILVLTIIGCACEAYISPVLLENIIKF